MFFAKMSLLLLYIRFFSVKKSTRYAIYFGLAFTFCLTLASIPVAAYGDTPSAGKSWALTNLMTKSSKTNAFAIAQGALNVVIDLYIFILPIPVVLGLQMSLRKRIGLLAVFLTGIL